MYKLLKEINVFFLSMRSFIIVSSLSNDFLVFKLSVFRHILQQLRSIGDAIQISRILSPKILFFLAEEQEWSNHYFL